MKAIVYQNFGSPDILRFEEIDKPTPADNEVLIKVRAASVNPLDWKLMKGGPFILRLLLGLGKSKIKRSEEHTSELQSRLHLVCRLLLEKKKVNYALLPSPKDPPLRAQPIAISLAYI